MRVFFNAIVVQVFLSIYVLWRGCQAVPPKNKYRLPLIAFFALELVIYFIGFFFSHHIPSHWIHYFAWVGTSWMVFILYMTALLLFYDLLYYLSHKHIFLKGVDFSKIRYRAIYYLSSLLLILGVMTWGNYKFRNPEITHLRIEINKPSKLDSLRIVVATDLHAGYLIRKDMIRKYVNLIMAQKPDLILLVGDVIDFDIASVVEQNMQEEFRDLQAPYGVYVSTGNHEYIGLANEEAFAKVEWLADSTNFVMLRDTTVLVKDLFYLAGREDDMYLYRKSELADVLENVNTDLPVILMNHEPRDIHEASRYGIDLAFYGHTHNGQFFPANMVTKIMWELSYGYRQINDSHIYVSSGLGLAGPQYRIGTISEIVVCDVIFGKE